MCRMQQAWYGLDPAGLIMVGLNVAVCCIFKLERMEGSQAGLHTPAAFVQIVMPQDPCRDGPPGPPCISDPVRLLCAGSCS